ncbi:MAG: YadA C-terminal domain-containing protein [Megamonas funiformis]|uniref:YadA C-terminal domain-containing protein n=1 Tax=Megamonas funiformis TaxID=437897 RepID=UPI0039933F3B
MFKNKKNILTAVLCATSFIVFTPSSVSFAADTPIDKTYNTDDNKAGNAHIIVNEDTASIEIKDGKYEWDSDQGKTNSKREIYDNGKTIKDSIIVQDNVNWQNVSTTERLSDATTGENSIVDKTTLLNKDGTTTTISRGMYSNNWDDSKRYIEDSITIGEYGSSIKTSILGTTFTSKTSEGASSTIISGGHITTDSLTIGDYTIDSGNIGNIVNGTGQGESTGGSSSSEEISSLKNNVNNLSNKVDDMSNRMNNMDKRINDLDDRLNDVGAMSAAIASLKPLPYKSNVPIQVSAGVGTYKGSTALALGLFHYADPNALFNLSISTSGDEVMAGFGATWNIE